MDDPALTARRVASAIELAQTASNLPSPHEMLNFVVAHIHKIIPCDLAALNECDLSTGEVAATAMDDQPTSLPIPIRLNHRATPLPLLANFESTRRLDPVRLSDVCPANWRGSPSYNQVFRPMGAEHQAGVGMAYQEPLLWGVAMNRSSVEFSDTDLTLLRVIGSIMRPSLAAYIDRQRIRDLLLGNGSEQGLVTFDGDWERILDVQSAAADLLNDTEYTTSLPGFARRIGELAQPLEPSVPRRLGGLEFTRLPQTDAHTGTLVVSRQNHSDPLTARQREILESISRGLSPREIAQALEISPRTVETHIQNAYARLKVNNRMQALNDTGFRFPAFSSTVARQREITNGSG